MTLIIGIQCHDGVVVGADGAATLGALGMRTVRQPVRKLTIIDGRVIVGVSGPVGLGQRYVHEVETLWSGKKLSGKKPVEAMTVIRDALWTHAEKELKAASVAAQVLGPQLAAQSALAHALVAYPAAKEPCLIQFSEQCCPELADPNLPFVAIGIGQPIADPFLAFLREIFWPNRLPSVNDGIFATLWTLRHAIATNPGGVADPIQIAVLEKSGGDWGGKILGDAELREHDEAITAAKARLASFPEAFQKDAQGIEPPPKPPRQ